MFTKPPVTIVRLREAAAIALEASQCQESAQHPRTTAKLAVYSGPRSAMLPGTTFAAAASRTPQKGYGCVRDLFGIDSLPDIRSAAVLSFAETAMR
jgi:hypothetical protein